MRNKLWIGFYLMLMFGCGVHKKGLADSADATQHDPTSHYLLGRLHDMDSEWLSFFYSKGTLSYWVVEHGKSEKSESYNNIKTTLKIQSDSVIHVLLSVMGLPMMNMQLSPTELWLVNKRQKCFMRESISTFLSRYQLPFLYDDVEDILLARPIKLDSSYHYLAGSEPNVVLARSQNTENYWEIRYQLSPDMLHLEQTDISSPSRHLSVHYADYIPFLSGEEEDFLFPKNTTITLSDQVKTVNISLSFDKLEVNKPKNMTISQPENYETCR